MPSALGSLIVVIEREKVCRNQVIVYFEPSIENLEDFVDVHVQLAIMRNTQIGTELRIMKLLFKSLFGCSWLFSSWENIHERYPACSTVWVKRVLAVLYDVISWLQCVFLKDFFWFNAVGEFKTLVTLATDHV